MKGSKGNKLRAPYKDRNKIESTPKQFVRKPFHYNEPKESLFYKEAMAKVKRTAKCAEKQSRTRKSGLPGEAGTKKSKVGWIVNSAS